MSEMIKLTEPYKLDTCLLVEICGRQTSLGMKQKSISAEIDDIIFGGSRWCDYFFVEVLLGFCLKVSFLGLVMDFCEHSLKLVELL